MLNGTLTLHDIRDVEAFCAELIPASTSREDREDLHAYLIETCWELSLHHKPGTRSFSARAGQILRQRRHDWQRQRNGRTRWQFATHTYERPRPILVSHDDLGDGLHAALATPGWDHARDGDPRDLVRLLRERSSDEAWRDDQRRKTLPRRAA